MSVNTVAFIATKNKDVFRVVNAATDALRDHLRSKANGNVIELMRAATVDTELCASSRAVRLDFKDDDKGRSLAIFFDCDGDYKDVHDGPKIILSFGHWGNSVELILVAGRAIAAELKAPLWWTESDCSSENWVKDGATTAVATAR